RRRNLPYFFHWLLLCPMFVYIAYDEAFQIHEKAIDPLRAELGGEDLGILYFSWVIPGAIIVCILTAAYIPFLLQLSKRIRAGFVLAAALYVGGALGVELIGGSYAEAHGNENLTYSFIVTVEESLEMFG